MTIALTAKRMFALVDDEVLSDEEIGDDWELRRYRPERNSDGLMIRDSRWVIRITDSGSFIDKNGMPVRYAKSSALFTTKEKAEKALLLWLMTRTG